jgi:predicted outer membrane repeat protein
MASRLQINGTKPVNKKEGIMLWISWSCLKDKTLKNVALFLILCVIAGLACLQGISISSMAPSDTSGADRAPVNNTEIPANGGSTGGSFDPWDINGVGTDPVTLTLNRDRYAPGDHFELVVRENWQGVAHLYVGVASPDGSFFFLTPAGLTLDLLPYSENQFARETEAHTVLSLDLPAGLPIGNYTFYAAAVPNGDFSQMMQPIAQVTFLFDTRLYFDQEGTFPNGLIGRRYSRALLPENGTPPYQIELVSGHFPPGLVLDPVTGAIEGEPTQAGIWELSIHVSDGVGNTASFVGTIRVYRALQVGPHGTFQDIQMALKMAQEMDIIQIEKGTYQVTNLIIPSTKQFQNGIRISGGWDATFENQSSNPGDTVLDGHQAQTRILTLQVGPVDIDNLTFANSAGGAAYFDANSSYSSSSFTNCSFSGNSAEQNGGAVYSYSSPSSFTNCSFSGNSAGGSGGAAYFGSYSNSSFTNCSFSGNSAEQNGGAVDFYSSHSNSSFINCSFSGNSAEQNGGAVYSSSYSSSFTNCSFYRNTSGMAQGGAIFQNAGGTIRNCIFYQNIGRNVENDISSTQTFSIDYSLVNAISATVFDYGAHNISGDPRFVDPENGDLRLRSDSPAIDAGDNATVQGIQVDLANDPRIVGSAVDMGAYEYQ